MPDGFFELPAWDAPRHLEVMDRLGHRPELPVDLLARRPLRRRRGRPGPRPRGERRRSAGGRGPSRPVRPARLAAGARRRPERSRRSPTATTSSMSTASPCSPTWAASTSVIRCSSRCSTSSTGATPGCSCTPRHRCAGSTPSFGRPRPDARVLLRHHPGRRQPGAQRHHRPPPEHRGHRPARRGHPAGRRRPHRRLHLRPHRRRSGRRRLRRPRAPPLRPGRLRRSPASSTRCWPSPPPTTCTTAATTPSPPTASSSSSPASSTGPAIPPGRSSRPPPRTPDGCSPAGTGSTRAIPTSGRGSAELERATTHLVANRHHRWVGERTPLPVRWGSEGR